jgi:WhiB family redox-sensing transcriptional regulator
VTVRCVNCRAEFEPPKHGPAKYCSQACRQAGYRSGGIEGDALAPEGDWAWRDRAACLGVDSAVFFPEVGRTGPGRPTKARAICEGCEVQPECLDFAISTRQPLGIWGGVNADERRRIRKRVSWQRRRTA